FVVQAEDGIRDFHVTGVQTCALPISVHPGSPTTMRGTATNGDVMGMYISTFANVESGTLRATNAPKKEMITSVIIGETAWLTSRSEERRVGKEWRKRRNR